jgi:hypothetical protein
MHKLYQKLPTCYPRESQPLHFHDSLNPNVNFWENRWVLKWNHLKLYINLCNFRTGFHFSSFVKLKVSIKVSIGLLHIGSLSPLVVPHLFLRTACVPASEMSNRSMWKLILSCLFGNDSSDGLKINQCLDKLQ